MNDELKGAIETVAGEHGWDPLDLATVMSYETAGTFDPWKAGPTTQHGQHRGLIQWGEPQRKQYGVYQGMPVLDQVRAAGRYLTDRGVKRGDGILPIYAAINAGNAKNINASDAHNGGAPGTVLDKVRDQMDGHRRNGAALLGGTFRPINIDQSAAAISSGPEMPSWPGDQRLMPQQDLSLWQVQSDAYNVEQTAPWLMRGSTDTTPDANWSMTSQRLQEDLKSRELPIEQYAPMLAGSHSEAHYQENLASALQDFQRVSRLEQAGLSGTVLRIANQMLDPIQLGADILASTVAPEVVLGRRATRMGRVLYAGIAGASGGAAAGAISASVNPHHDAEEALYGAIFGFGVGGAVGALGRNQHTTLEASMLSQASRRAMNGDAAGAPIFGAVADAGSVGARKGTAMSPFLKEDAFDFLDEKDFPELFGKGLRWDLAYKLGSSPNVATKAGQGLVEDGTGKAKGALNPTPASREAERFNATLTTAHYRTYQPQLAEYLRDTNVSILGREKGERQFNDLIDRYIRDTRPDKGEYYPDSVKKVGAKHAQLYARMLKLQQNPFLDEGLQGRGVFGSTGIPTDANFAPRHWHPQRIVAALREYADGTIEELIGRAMRSANSALDDKLIGRTAKAFTKAIVNRSHGLEDMGSRILGSENIDTLVRVLVDEAGMDQKDAEALSAAFRVKEDAGRDSQLKHRLLLDENMKLDAPLRRDGTRDERGLSIVDLLDTDASRNFLRYTRNVSGRLALARYRFKDPVSQEVLIDGFASDAEFAQYIDKVRKKGGDLINQGKQTREQVDADVKRLEFAYRAIMGRPLHGSAEAGEFGYWSRVMRKFNFTRLMGQVGFAQIAEVAMPIASLGVKAAFSQVPALRRMLTQDGETILQSKLHDTLELWLGVGTDRLRGLDDYRIDELSSIHDPAQGGWRDVVENAANKSSRLVAEASGLTQANVMLERWSAATIIQAFTNAARKGGKAMSDKRMADLGLDEAMLGRVNKMLADDADVSLKGSKVMDVMFDNWSDKEARSAFINAAFGLSRQLIQKNDIGNLATWMSHPAAKLLFQFRSFMLGAWVKQTLKTVNMRDAQAARVVALSMALAGASYVAQMKIASIGRADRDEFLDKRLSPKALAAAAFARSGPSSIIPMLIDTGAYITGQDPLFSYSRTTGQVSNMFFGNPTTGLMDDVAQAGRGVAGIFRDGPWSQEEARALARVLPFGNALPIVMGLNAAIGDLPAFAPRDAR